MKLGKAQVKFCLCIRWNERAKTSPYQYHPLSGDKTRKVAEWLAPGDYFRMIIKRRVLETRGQSYVVAAQSRRCHYNKLYDCSYIHSPFTMTVSLLKRALITSIKSCKYFANSLNSCRSHGFVVASISNAGVECFVVNL